MRDRVGLAVERLQARQRAEAQRERRAFGEGGDIRRKRQFVKTRSKFNGTLGSLLDILNNIRLATLLENNKTKGRVKAVYKLEEISAEESNIVEALGINNLHNDRPKLKGVSVYK